VVYEILKAISQSSSDWQLYFLGLSDGFQKRISVLSELEQISQDYGTWGKSNVASRVAQLLPGPLKAIVREVWRLYRFRLYIPRSLYPANALLGRESILHVHSVLPGLSSLKPRGALVWTEHSKGSLLREIHVQEGSRPTGVLARSLKDEYRFLLERSDLIVFPSLGAKALFEEYTGWEVPSDRFRVVYNGVPDPIKIYGLQPEVEQGLFVTIAQHVPDKGLDLSLEALSLFQSNRVSWRWVIIGGYTSWTRELERLVRKYRLSSKVSLLGSLTHLETMLWLNKAEIVLATPRVGVFDLAILEAMALRKPIIATPVGGVKEALGEDYPLYASDPEKIVALLNLDGDTLNKVGKVNRERYENFFTLSSMIKAYVAIYKKLGSGFRSKELV